MSHFLLLWDCRYCHSWLAAQLAAVFVCMGSGIPERSRRCCLSPFLKCCWMERLTLPYHRCYLSVGRFRRRRHYSLQEIQDANVIIRGLHLPI
ncbi:hypothetical protein K402DRAFT_114246 [Aulographum hederae CBS 113979]|uniref:Secreted protein n=1 Tax=Aulographum hederae CBS 113979 TaxID=1176131 RepID=A0A6G1GWF1_9PEZI|nr:hypothetical protein K402DRAFT_114246 [Aulographum hederae CBS 113979]